MFNPKNPLSAAAIFVGGLAVVGYTILDINRTLAANEQPMSTEQARQLQDMIRKSAPKASGGIVLLDMCTVSSFFWREVLMS